VKNPRMLIWISAIIIIVGVLIAIRYANTGGVQKSATQAPVQGTAKLGEKAPQFAVPTTQGYFDLAKADRPVFLEVFATWCPHCQRETSVIDRLYQKYKGRVDFVAVTGSPVGMDGQSPESEQDVLNFQQRLHAQYPLAFDGSLAVAKEYLQGGFPTLAVIDRNKKITYLSSGETSFAELDNAIKSALR
jgi:cytochrome c biogenesis protein CcmG, thiol:disulfide interchange protein DsbE